MIKNISTMTFSTMTFNMTSYFFQLYPFDVMKLKHCYIYDAHKLQWESLHS